MSALVQKFGGSSLGTAEEIGRCADRVVETRAKGHAVVVVVSAMGGVTDELLTLAREVAPETRSRELDLLLATGEQASAALMSMAIERRGRPAVALTAHHLDLRTCGRHQDARIRSVDARRLRQELDAGRIPVVAGFQGIDDDGELTTFGRGGSDITAVAIAVALGDDTACEIYTDVDGVYTADPHVVDDARVLERIDPTTMLELAAGGAKVLHPRAVQLAWREGCRVRVRRDGTTPGTWVEGDSRVTESARVVACALTHDLARVDVPSIEPARLSLALAEHGLGLESLAFRHPGPTLSIVLPRDELSTLLDVLQDAETGRDVTIHEGWSRLTLAGGGFTSDPGLLAAVMRDLVAASVTLIDVETTPSRIVCFVPPTDAEVALRVVHRHVAALRPPRRRAAAGAR